MQKDIKQLINLPYDKKLKLIKQNKYLDVFINDCNYEVRVKVAEQNYGLNTLINDSY